MLFNLRPVSVKLIVAVFKYQQAVTYHHFDIEVYINEVNDDEILVKALPATDKDASFSGSYVIEKNDSLMIKDMEGGVVELL